MLVVPTESRAEGLVTSVKGLAEYFYADNILFASPHTDRLQRSFDVLTDLINWVGLLKIEEDGEHGLLNLPHTWRHAGSRV